MTVGRIADARSRRPLPASWVGRFWPIVAAVLAGLGTLARQTGVPIYRTIWAEDGQVFVQCAYSDPSPLHCVVTPYDGWLLIATRLLAEVASLMPPATLSYTLAGLSAIVAAGCAYLTARAVRDMTGSGVAGCVAGAGLLLVAPAAREIGGNLTNLHWIMFVASVTVLVATWLDHRFDVADGILVGLLAWSSPFSLVLLALAAFGVALGRRRLLPIVAVVGAAVVVQLGVALTAERIEVPDLPVTILSPIGWYVSSVIGAGFFGDRGPVPDALVTVALVAVVVGLLWRAVAGLRAHTGSARNGGETDAHAGAIRVDRPLLEIVAVAALFGAGLAVFALSTYLNRHVAPRYVYVPAALTIVALFTGAGLVARNGGAGDRRWPARWPGLGRIGVVALAVLVGVGFASSFRVRNAASVGPSVPGEIASALSDCTARATTVTIRISPLPTESIPTIWQIEIPCDRLVR